MARRKKNRGNPNPNAHVQKPVEVPAEIKKVVKTIHFEETDVLKITAKARSLGLTFSGYTRMVLKQSLGN